MTESTRTVMEKYQVRKTRRQKAEFRAWLEKQAESCGYEYHEEKGSFGAKNAVIGDPEKARVVFTAHYDTCARLPFPNFITPKNFLIYLLYQIAIVVLFMLLPMWLITAGLSALWSLTAWPAEVATLVEALAQYAWLLFFLFVLLGGPANRHTANDNTSGVTVLLDLMAELPPEHRPQAAFVFFDLEEAGLFGSSGFAARHKKAMKKKLLLNFDCVSDGSHIMLVLRRGARPYEAALKEAFADDTGPFTVEVATRGVFYPSDQANFPCGVGIAALRKTRRGLLYMNRIHTNKDTVYQEENIQFLTTRSQALIKNLLEIR